MSVDETYRLTVVQGKNRELLEHQSNAALHSEKMVAMEEKLERQQLRLTELLHFEQENASLREQLLEWGDLPSSLSMTPKVTHPYRFLFCVAM